MLNTSHEIKNDDLDSPPVITTTDHIQELKDILPKDITSDASDASDEEPSQDVNSFADRSFVEDSENAVCIDNASDEATSTFAEVLNISTPERFEQDVQNAYVQYPPSTSQLCEDDSMETWQQHPKHFLILNSSGKPIFSYHGDENALAGLMALVTAIISVVQDQGDNIKSIQSGSLLIVFKVKGPLYFVATSSLGESVLALSKQLEHLYNQIVLVVTTGLEKIILRNPAYDVRNLLDGVSPVLRALADLMSSAPNYLLGGVEPVPLPAADRLTISNALVTALKSSGAFYALLLVEQRVVGMERDKSQPSLHSEDVLLLMNFITCNESYKRGQSEAFCPVCMPHFNADVFLHAYVHYLDLELGMYIVIMGGSAEAFHSFSAARSVLESSLAASGGLLERLKQCTVGTTGVRLHMEQLPKPLGGSFPHTPLWHYIARHVARRQLIVPSYSEPFAQLSRRSKLSVGYTRLHSLLHEVPDPSKPNRVVWSSNDEYALLGLCERELELYMVLDPLTEKGEAMLVADSLKRHLLDSIASGDVLIPHTFA